MELESVNIIKENDSGAREEEQKLIKRVQVYKDTMTLIKLKMNKADTLIRQYNDKMKECNILNQEFTLLKNEKQDILKKYNLTMEKNAKLELLNIDYKQSSENYKNTIDKQKIKLNENDVHINQLIFKIKYKEEQYLALEDKVKTLEHDLKSAKSSIKSFEKKCNKESKEQESQTISLEKRDISVITDPIIIVPEQLKMINKGVMTDEYFTIKKEPFPLYCTKCEAAIIPAPVEQILKIMSSNPPFLSENLSPPTSPKLAHPNVKVNELFDTNLTVKRNIHNNNKNNEVQSSSRDEDYQNPGQNTEESKHFTFMELDKLTRKINVLEKLIKKNKIDKKQNNCFHKNCCSSKDIKLILQLPNEEKFFEFRKREKRKLNGLYRKCIKNIAVKKVLKNNEWLIEDFSKPNKRKIRSHAKEKLPNKKKKKSYNEETEDLFESSKVSIPDIISNDYISENIYASKENLASSIFPDPPSVSPPISDIIEMNLDEIEHSSTEDVNIDEPVQKLQSTSCNSATSQALVSENIYLPSIEKENCLVHKINERVRHIGKHNLPLRIESINKSRSIFDVSDNETEYRRTNIESSNDVHDINQSIFTENNSITDHNNDKFNENYILSKNPSVSNVIPDIIGKSIDKYNNQDTDDEINEQEKNLVSYEKHERNTFKNVLVMPVNIKDNEKCKYSSYDQNSQESSLVSHESNKVLDTNKILTPVNSNLRNEQIKNSNEEIKNSNEEIKNSNEEIKNSNEEIKNTNEETENTNEEIENTSEDNNSIDETSISDGFSNAIHLSVNKNISTDIVNKKKEVEDHSVFQEPASNELFEMLHPEEKRKLQFTPEEAKLIDFHTATVQSVNEVQNNNSLIEEANNAFDVRVNDLTENENSIPSDKLCELNVPSTITEDKQCTNTSDVCSSDESSEERNISICTSTYKKSEVNCKKNLLLTRRKKLLSKIRNIHKNSKNLIIPKKQKTDILQVKEKIDHLNLSIESQNNSIASIENIPIFVVPKKQRIAHIPKSININKNNKSNNQAMKIIQKNQLDSKDQLKESDDKVSLIIQELDKNFKEMVKDSSTTTPFEPILPLHCTSLKTSSNDPKSTSHQKNILKNNTSLTSQNKDSQNTDKESNNDNNVKQSNDKIENTVECNASSTQISLQNLKVNEMHTKYNDLSDNSSSIIEIKSVDNTNVTEQLKIEMDIVNNSQDENPVRKLRSRQITINNKRSKKKKLKKSSQCINETNSCLRNTIVISYLNERLSNRKEASKREKGSRDESKFKQKEKFTMEQLDLLIKSEEWTAEINSNIMENLINSQDLKYTAYFIIEYAAEKIKGDEVFDKSHTPPAPIMTRIEQKLVTLIIEINKKFPDFSDIITQGIQFRIFKRSVEQELQVQILERLFRILVVLNKIKKDREKVRIYCCDALYCFNLRAINIIYVAVTCWPEILPKYDSNSDVIVKTIVYIIMTQQAKKYCRLSSLQKLLITYYNYPNSGYSVNNIKTELLKSLRENAPGITTAILLLCKRMGPLWSLDNIIKELKQMIVTQDHSSLYEVLTLLGNIIRAIPFHSNFKQIYVIIDQLCDVLDNCTGADVLQESIVSCLLSISKFKFEQIALCVLKWQFDKDLRPLTKNKLVNFFKCHDNRWWWNFIKENFPPNKEEEL